ncbi:ABC transporter substrate-binding protein [Burkholderia dolosa]|uniref:ABC transporter substrate-binding protein n=1 Tax=Burkholderia dolosa TaxID=152500 RepID=A0A892IAW5_9BURK|nr:MULTISPECIES: ABC transporter substrate-binding protein [Burkholderia]AKE06066.1 ABC transporter substrate-binding protein [Burkholderia cepacia]AJY09441.1 bacterial extracellular solute-binding s, 5 Middle family protein [Burkholderia dolosa AU0158]AYZ95249.1 ABC transporter substrate-binding protein [Burkholderia dolosa]EAY70675.1 ABC-type dipeptide transport system periplasmic component [Burkholderia dolosa AU0158]ETP62680.1 ABC transporter substrate-binding protein [Burkholderia dolosa 
MKPLTSRLVASLAAAAVLAAVPFSAARAETPKDMFVMATLLDEFTTLDPGEIYELVPEEYVANTYDRLVRVDLRDPSKFNGDVAQSWTVSADGLTYTFKLRSGLKFHSGNPLTADDVAWSIQRAVLLDKGPAAVLTGIGLTKANVAANVKKIDDQTVAITTDRKYAPTFVLNVLGSWPASVVDKKLLLSHQQGSDFGNAWLKTNEAGSGAYRLVKWTAGDSIVLQRFDGYRLPLAMKRIVLRHVPEAASQRLLLENGDVDAARDLSPDDLASVVKSGKAKVVAAPQATLLYLGLNTKNPTLAKPDVQEALKWLVDYSGIQSNVVKTTYKVHQTFLPEGFLGALNTNPYKLDVAKAKALLAKAGVPDGFTVTMDVRNDYPYTEIAQAVQANFAQAGVKVQLIPGDNKQTLAKYRARQHDIYIGEWSADYIDPHSNAQGFAWNPDNSDKSSYKMLAWRNRWDIPKLTKETDAALAEPTAAKRAQLYQAMQKELLARSPFVIMFEKVAQVATRPGVSGLEVGPINDLVSYRNLKKQ